MLEARGDDLLKARHWVEAMVVAAAPDGPIQLLVTDAVMPQMKGFDRGEKLSAGSAYHGGPVQLQTLLAALHDELRLARRAVPGMSG